MKRWSEMTNLERKFLVAEKVMGFVWWRDGNGQRILVAPEDVKHHAKYAPAATGEEQISTNHNDVPDYPSSRVALWPVLDKFEQDGYSISLYKGGTSGKWSCTFSKNGQLQKGKYVVLGGSAQADTINDAVCLASLRASGVDIRE